MAQGWHEVDEDLGAQACVVQIDTLDVTIVADKVADSLNEELWHMLRLDLDLIIRLDVPIGLALLEMLVH